MSTTYITTSKLVSPNNELNDTKERDQDTVIDIDETRPKVLIPQKRTEKVNLKETILEENNVDLLDGRLDDNLDENSVSNASLDPATNNDKPKVLEKTNLMI